jgi:hypothetical protein
MTQVRPRVWTCPTIPVICNTTHATGEVHSGANLYDGFQAHTMDLTPFKKIIGNTILTLIIMFQCTHIVPKCLYLPQQLYCHHSQHSGASFCNTAVPQWYQTFMISVYFSKVLKLCPLLYLPCKTVYKHYLPILNVNNLYINTTLLRPGIGSASASASLKS